MKKMVLAPGQMVELSLNKELTIANLCKRGDWCGANRNAASTKWRRNDGVIFIWNQVENGMAMWPVCV
jgi:hypothetical protein